MDHLYNTQSGKQRFSSDGCLTPFSSYPALAPLALTAVMALLAACGEKNVTRSYYPSGSVKTEAITKDAVLNGRALMMSETGGKLSEAEYKGGVLFGKSVAYFADGKVKASAEYEDGALHGSSLSFYENGQKASEATFHRGVLVGPVRSWTETGLEKDTAKKS
jgi:hypothetical protein